MSYLPDIYQHFEATRLIVGVGRNGIVRLTDEAAWYVHRLPSGVRLKANATPRPGRPSCATRECRRRARATGTLAPVLLVLIGEQPEGPLGLLSRIEHARPSA